MRKPLLLLSLALILSGCTPSTGDTGSSASSESTAFSSAAPAGLPNRYDNSAGYSINYPAGWTVKENDILNTATDPLTGVSFTVPESMIQGTKALEVRVHVAVTGVCPMLDRSTSATVGMRDFIHADWGDVGAGNLYTGDVYMLNENAKCYVLTLFTHQCNLGPDCGANSGDFDIHSVTETFTKMVESFHVTTIPMIP